MKKILFLFYFILSINYINAQENIGVNLNVGLPITKIENSFDFGNFYAECSFHKIVFEKIYLGLGINYSSIDIEPSNNLLSYDRNTFYYFIFLGPKFLSKKGKIVFSPQIKIGYAFYKYSLNEFETLDQNDNGFYIAPGLVGKYKVSDKLFINTHLFYNIIFDSFDNNINFPIPDNYIKTTGKYIKDINIGIGLTYLF